MLETMTRAFPIHKSIMMFGILLLFCQCESQNEEKIMDEDCKEECCSNESSTGKSETSEITCPNCGHTETETLPTDVCVIKYNCKECGTEMSPKKGDCCVFCTYGTHKCPSMQDE